MGFFFICGIIAGCVFAAAVTMFIVVSVIKKSNDWGDYDSARETMVEFEMLSKANNVKESFSVYDND